MATLPGWYLTQLSTMIYVPFFACMAGTGITQQARRDLGGKLGTGDDIPSWYPKKPVLFSWMEMVKHDLFHSWIFQVPGFIVTILMIAILE